MKLDGTGLYKIYSDAVYLSFQISNGYIFYAGGNNDTLYRIRPDGTEKMKLTSDTTGNSFSIGDNAIYYIKHKVNFESEGSIYKINLDGTGKTALGINNASIIKAFDGLIYYSIIDKIFKAKLDGTGITEIDSKGWEDIKVFGRVF